MSRGENMDRLRRETADDHERIERSLDLLRPDFSLDDYRRLLERFFGYISPLEPRLESFHDFSERGFDLSARRKTGWLRDDLLWLGHSDESIRRLPLASGIPRVTTFFEAVGCLYVLEGSTLGGQVVLKHLGPRLDISTTGGGRYFASYGAHVGEFWNGFCVFASTLSADEMAPAAAGAREAFRTLEQWILAGAKTI